MLLKEIIYKTLYRLFDLVAMFGLPLSILAWVTVFSGSMGMAFVLRSHNMERKWKASIVVGSTALAAHLFDYYVTLRISPDLSLEANPLWRIVVDKMGLKVALWYGLTGKFMLAILSFEFFAFYLIYRESLFPGNADSFISFCKNFGRKKNGKGLNLSAMLNIFAFLFSLIGLFCFYIAFLNSLVDENLYLIMPSMPLMLLVYLSALVFIYFGYNYWSFKKSSNHYFQNISKP